MLASWGAVQCIVGGSYFYEVNFKNGFTVVYKKASVISSHCNVKMSYLEYYNI